MRNEILRNQLEKQGMTPDQVEKFIKNVELEELEAQNELKKLLKVKEVSELLVKNLDESWNPAKVRRFIATGDLKTENQVNRLAEEGMVSTKTGYRVHVDALNEFIGEMKMSKGDWKAEALRLREENKALEEKLLHFESVVPESRYQKPQQDVRQEDNKEGVKTLPIEKKRKNDPVTKPVELGEFDFSRVAVTHLKNPKDLSTSHFIVGFRLNGENCSAVIYKTGEPWSINAVDNLDRSIIYERDTHKEYMERLEKVLFPKIEKKIK